MITLRLDEYIGSTQNKHLYHAMNDNVNRLYGYHLVNEWEISFSHKPFVSGNDWNFYIKESETMSTAATYEEAVSLILEHEEIDEVA